MMPAANGKPDIDMSVYGTQIGIVMLIAFAFNLLFCPFYQMEIRIPYRPHVLVPLCIYRSRCGRGPDRRQAHRPGNYFYGGLYGNIPEPDASSCQEVTGDDSFTIGHPTTVLSLISGYLRKIDRGQEAFHGRYQIPQEPWFPA